MEPVLIILAFIAIACIRLSRLFDRMENPHPNVFQIIGEKFTPRRDKIIISWAALRSLLYCFESLPNDLQQKFRESIPQNQRYGLWVLLGGYRNGKIEPRHLTQDTLEALTALQKWAVLRSFETHLTLFNALPEVTQIDILNNLDQWTGDLSGLNNAFMDNGFLTKENYRLCSQRGLQEAFHRLLKPLFFQLCKGTENESIDCGYLQEAKARGLYAEEFFPILAEELLLPGKGVHGKQVIIE